MGGSAFPALRTPRMPLSVYQHVLQAVHAKLLTLHAQVSTPIEAPAKVDYGDVDVLVYQLLPVLGTADGETDVNAKVPLTEEGEGKDTSPTEDKLAALLGAKTWKHDKGSEEIHFAIPWPEEFRFEDANEITASSPPEAPTITTAVSELSVSSPPEPHPTDQLRFIQIDLHICPTLRTYDWQLLRCAHGDFWSIVGSMIRRYGLSFRNDGLYVRMAELEKVNHKGSLVLLSGDPRVVLGFLFGNRGGKAQEMGGEEKEDDAGDMEKEIYERYWKRDAFEDVEDMCNFIRGNCRFYRPDREGFVAVAVDGGDVDQENRAKLEVDTGSHSPPKIQKKDRYRFHKRDAFRYWLLEYVPMHSAADREAGTMGEFAGMKREEVAKMVVERFGVVEEFEKKKMVGLKMVGVEGLWGELRKLVEGVLREEKEKATGKGVRENGDATGSDSGNGDGSIEGKSDGNVKGNSNGKNESQPEGDTNTQPADNVISLVTLTTTNPTSPSSPHPTLPTLEPSFVIRTLRRRLSLEPRALPIEELDDMQRAYRAGNFDEVKEWIESHWKEVAETKQRENAVKSAIHYKEKCEREEKEKAEWKKKERGTEGKDVTDVLLDAAAVEVAGGGEAGAGVHVQVLAEVAAVREGGKKQQETTEPGG